MQHLGDVESSGSSTQYHAKMERRNNAAICLGYLLPNIHTQLIQSKLAKTGMENQLNYAQGLKQFHEHQRLYFYPYIFQNQNAKVIDWTRQTVKTFTDPEKISLLKVFLPYLIFIFLFIFLSQIKFRKLC